MEEGRRDVTVGTLDTTAATCTPSHFQSTSSANKRKGFLLTDYSGYTSASNSSKPVVNEEHVLKKNYPFFCVRV